MSKPSMFGRYLLLDRVASGGMAEVWRGRISGEGNFQRIIAIKKILPHVAEDEDFIKMFTDEALITANLQHANIGQVHEFSRVGDVYFISMEYISGKDLKTLWSYNRSRKTILPFELSAHIISKMADGLDYAHRRRDNFGNDAGIVHRDVSPQNCLISWEGEVKIIDFGIAKAAEKSSRTRPGTLKGKFAYMSPEQIRGLGLDGRADVFSLGVVLYELVTGERGFTADSEFSLLEMVRNVEIRPPSVVNRDLPPEIERIIYKALAKDREHRYQTAAELSEDLQRFLLTRGRAPTRHDVSKFLKENFTVDWEKERARLESYKEIRDDDFSSDDDEPPGRAGSNSGVGAPGGSKSGSRSGSAPQKPASGKSPRAPVALDDDSSAFAETAAFNAPDTAAFSDTAEADPIRPAASSLSGRERVENNSQRTPITNTRGPAPAPSRAPTPAKSGRGARVFAIAAAATLVVVGVAAAAWIFLLQPRGTIVVTVAGAPHARVLIDGVERGEATPSLTIADLPAGAHTLIVEEPGYITFSAPFVADRTLLNLKAPLRRAGGHLVISSTPAGAAIFLDGKATEQKTPARIEVEPDTPHEIVLRADGYRDARIDDLKAKSAIDTPVKLTLRPDRIIIRIASEPEGATVKLAGKALGVTPLELERTPDEPPPQVLFEKKGCQPLSTSIAVDTEKADQRFDVSLRCK